MNVLCCQVVSLEAANLELEQKIKEYYERRSSTSRKDLTKYYVIMEELEKKVKQQPTIIAYKLVVNSIEPHKTLSLRCIPHGFVFLCLHASFLLMSCLFFPIVCCISFKIIAMAKEKHHVFTKLDSANLTVSDFKMK